MRKLIDKHKTLINWYQKKFKLTDYQLLWLVFFKDCRYLANSFNNIEKN